MSFGKTVVKLAVVAGVAYGGYYLYKKYIKKDGRRRETHRWKEKE